MRDGGLQSCFSLFGDCIDICTALDQQGHEVRARFSGIDRCHQGRSLACPSCIDGCSCIQKQSCGRNVCRAHQSRVSTTIHRIHLRARLQEPLNHKRSSLICRQTERRLFVRPACLDIRSL